MSVTNQTPYKQFVAAPGATLFSTDFRVILASDLVVRKDGVVQLGGFTISGLNAPAGADVTFGVPMVGGEVIELQRSVPLTRATDYQQTGDFLSPVVNTDFDRLWMALQDSQFLSNLAILLPVGDPLAPMTIPDVASRASRFLAFDALGQAIAAAGASGVPVSDFIATLLDDADAAAARATLGALAASMNTARLLGRLTAGAGPAEELTAAQVTASFVNAATDAAAGKVQLASNAVAQAGVATDRAMTPAGMKAAQIQLLASVALVNQTAVDFTSVPSWVKRLTFVFASASSSGSSVWLVQLGDAGGIETAGYVAVGGGYTSASGVANYTTGFGVSNSNAAGAIREGILVLQRLGNTNTWVAVGQFARSGDAVVAESAQGGKTLSDVLTQARLTTVNGTDQYDAGTVCLFGE
jgi:hypothetical protein